MERLIVHKLLLTSHKVVIKYELQVKSVIQVSFRYDLDSSRKLECPSLGYVLHIHIQNSHFSEETFFFQLSLHHHEFCQAQATQMQSQKM